MDHSLGLGHHHAHPNMPPLVSRAGAERSEALTDVNMIREWLDCRYGGDSSGDLVIVPVIRRWRSGDVCFPVLAHLAGQSHDDSPEST
jgi:hypothetical protein